MAIIPLKFGHNFRLSLPLAILAALPPGMLFADAPPDAHRSYHGIWAGERMLCSRPTHLLHVYGRTGSHHPAIFQDSPSYSCRMRKVRGQSPEWKLELNCTSSGTDDGPATLPASQTLTLLEGGKILRMTMHSQRGEELWADDLHWCRPFKTHPHLKHIH